MPRKRVMGPRKRKIVGGKRGGLARLLRYFPNVETISDSSKRTELITVKEQDLRGGIKNNGRECAFAKACKRQLHLDGALIGLAISYLVKGTHVTRYKTPASVAREITTFDRHKDFDEGKYTLSAICPSERLGAQRVISGNHPRGEGGTKDHGLHRVYHKTSRVRQRTV